MEMKKVWAMYFSPTGGTEKAVKTTAKALAEKLDLPLGVYDWTLPGAREKEAVFGEGDIVVCGTPVIAGQRSYHRSAHRCPQNSPRTDACICYRYHAESLLIFPFSQSLRAESAQFFHCSI